ncbi:hypothetical protein HRG_010018 [Hirsutella rhossiliensis]|uniref:Uncharacterized protein n=1 Tax=Hirsutella rhossiliensis TaxID=111463 RepID=A0A9P8MNX7_9HYPO|nr:uncharacterized protein HRG_10018 [Hirsutella rhossiliensis]KAH0958973.1 hypothetical protein HRG_10018 [Hirsutella rhossiliensis]
MTFSCLFLISVDQRRNLLNADGEAEAVKNDSIVGYETVMYFNADEFKSRRFRWAMGAFQRLKGHVEVDDLVKYRSNLIVSVPAAKKNLDRVDGCLECE